MKEIYEALGWQGGTVHQIVEEIKRLKEVENELQSYLAESKMSEGIIRQEYIQKIIDSHERRCGVQGHVYIDPDKNNECIFCGTKSHGRDFKHKEAENAKEKKQEKINLQP